VGARLGRRLSYGLTGAATRVWLCARRRRGFVPFMSNQLARDQVVEVSHICQRCHRLRRLGFTTRVCPVSPGSVRPQLAAGLVRKRPHLNRGRRLSSALISSRGRRTSPALVGPRGSDNERGWARRRRPGQNSGRRPCSTCCRSVANQAVFDLAARRRPPPQTPSSRPARSRPQLPLWLRP
jgi:hypothetical protein